ncbi:MAG: MFS transporter, partial [Nitrospinota bacterium]|nr:MFS transporter [Nitrospinota bacterium]
IYLGGYLLQVPLLILAAVAGGIPLLLVAVLMVAINTGILPAENLLLAVNTPTRHHGMAFGLKFVLTFGLGPIAVQFIAWATDGSGGLAMVFGALAACGLLGVGLVYWLPADSATGRAASPSNT